MSVNTSIFNWTNITLNVPITTPACYQAKIVAVMFVAVGTLVGNHLIVFIFVKNVKMRTVTNTMVINMCIADIMSVVGDVIFYLIEAIHSELFREFPFCRVSMFIFQWSTQAVVLSMVAIAVDRYYNLVHISQHGLRRELARFIVGFVWFQSFVLSLPWDLFNTDGSTSKFALAICTRLPYRYSLGMNMPIFRDTFKVVSVLVPYFVIIWIFIQVVLAARRRRTIEVEDSAIVNRAPKTERFTVYSYGRSSVNAVMLFSTFLILTLPFLGSVCWSLVTGKSKLSFKMELAEFFLFRLQGMLLPMIYLFRNRFVFDFLRKSHCSCCRLAQDHITQREGLNLQHLRRNASRYKHRQGLESTKTGIKESKYVKQANRIKIFYTANAEKELRGTFTDLISVNLEQEANETQNRKNHTDSRVIFILEAPNKVKFDSRQSSDSREDTSDTTVTSQI